MSNNNNKLPLLPGFRPHEVHNNQSYKKGRGFQMNNGVLQDTEPLTKAELDKAEKLEEEKAKLRQQEIEANKPLYKVPETRNVLRFEMYRREDLENKTYRIRHYVLLYFLEDDTIKITEPRIDNSGLSHGVIVGRAKLIKDRDTNKSYTLLDFKLGSILNIRGRKYHVIDCDERTKTFFNENNLDLGKKPKDIPIDPIIDKQSKEPKRTDFRKKLTKELEYMDALKGRTIQNTRKWYENNNKVLRFEGLWEDPHIYGERRYYSVNYYLEDDTVEVLERLGSNSGRDNFPHLLKRSPLPKHYKDSVASVATIGVRSENEYYGPEDFRVGERIDVFGRQLFLFDADHYTKDWYRNHLGYDEADFPIIDVQEPEEDEIVVKVPPHNGFGTEEDSLQNVKNLVPKPIKRDVQKLLAMEGKVLQFEAQLLDNDEVRRFTINYYLGDDTVSVFEKQIRNSGYPGGKFFDRKKPREAKEQPVTKFYVGANVTINAHHFYIIGCTKFTADYIATHPQWEIPADVNQ